MGQTPAHTCCTGLRDLNAVHCLNTICHSDVMYWSPALGGYGLRHSNGQQDNSIGTSAGYAEAQCATTVGYGTNMPAVGRTGTPRPRHPAYGNRKDIMLKRKRLIVLVAGLALVAGSTGALVSRASPSHAGKSQAIVRGAVAPAINTTGWSNVDEARASLEAIDPASRAEFGLSQASLAQIRVFYTFPASTPSFARVSVFEVPRPGRGSCLYVLDTGGCSARPAAINDADALPVQASVTDWDRLTGPLPIMLVGDVAPQVNAVTVSCDGRTFSATVSRNVVAWVAPSAAIDPSGCVLRATLVSGKTFSETL
jgi:hypothetical protein